jgi:hypothetical protein
MAEPRFADEDDLPRTFRRERDARERELREREAPPLAGDDAFATPTHASYANDGYGDDYGLPSGTVTRFKVPFFHLMVFFIKAVLAAIPAMILLGVLLWGFGQGLKTFVPQLRHFEIIVKSVA